MPIHMIVESVDGAGNPEQYLRHKLRAFFGSERNEDQNVRKMLRRPIDYAVPLVDSGDHPAIHGAAAREVAKAKACLIDEVSSHFSLEGDEVIVHDEITYLAREYRGYPAGTGAMRRTTNQGRFVFLAPEVRVVGTGLARGIPQRQSISAVHRPESALSARMVTGGGLAQDLLIECAKGLASEVGSQIGAAVLSQVFGGGSIDLEQLEHDLAVIVKQANVEQTVHEQHGRINGAVTNMSTYYRHRKASHAPKHELYDYLVDQERGLQEAISTLQEEMFREKGLSTFIAAANVMIGVLQEMALQDYQVDDPADSSNTAVIKDDVAGFIAHTNEMHRTVLAKRVGQVTAVYDNPFVDCDPPVCKSRYYYEDGFTGKLYGPFEQIGKKDDAQARAAAERTKLTNSLTESMKWMDDVVKAWQPILEHPLGKVAEMPAVPVS